MILHLLLLTGARGKEVRLAERADLNWDGHANYKGPVWIVPGDRLHRGRRVRGRTKSGRPKVLPLSIQAGRSSCKQPVAPARARLFDVAERSQVNQTVLRLIPTISRRVNVNRQCRSGHAQPTIVWARIATEVRWLSR
jgi:hypothetical protein